MFRSLTPASMSGSAPSVSSRCSTIVSAVRPRVLPEAPTLPVRPAPSGPLPTFPPESASSSIAADRCRSALVERPRRRRLRESDGVPEARRAREPLNDTVHPQRDATMWRRARRERVEQEAELLLDLVVPQIRAPGGFRRWSSGSWMRMLPDPNSVPLYTRSYAVPRTDAGSVLEQCRCRPACGITNGWWLGEELAVLLFEDGEVGHPEPRVLAQRCGSSSHLGDAASRDGGEPRAR